MTPAFIIRWYVYLRESLYQWRATRHDRWRRIDYDATMKYYKDVK